MYQYRSAKLQEFKPCDKVFAPRAEICSTSTIPSSIQRCVETGRLEAFKMQWKEGDPNRPHIYWDSDVAKVMEGMAYDLILHPDDAREKELDELVDLVCSCQQPDGYLNSYFSGVEPEKRWKNLFNWHELYCAGHLMEAACAHFEATGKRKFLDAMCRYADYIGSVFGWEEGKKRGVPGHEEIELALCRLAQTSGNPAYFKLAEYFVDARGVEPNYFIEEGREFPTHASEDQLPNRQAHKPVREQSDAVGHAVRALYLYSGMADVAAENGDRELAAACERLFDSVTKRRMYITGGIGSTPMGESFTCDYDLPNNTNYAESCAAVSLAFFAERMLRLTGDGKYADVMERVLFNGALSGVSLSGDKFFYANLLEVNENSFLHGFTAAERQTWFTCSCCPTTYCRFLPQTGKYCWSVSENEVRMNIPVAGHFDCGHFAAEVSGAYPADGAVVIKILRNENVKLSLRIPGWCPKAELAVNGKALPVNAVLGFVTLDNVKAGDELSLTLDMPTELIYANSSVAADAGRAAICRGPVVYCIESCDNPGVKLHNVVINRSAGFSLAKGGGLPEGLPAVRFSGWEEVRKDNDALYTNEPPELISGEFTAIPYSLWQNREKGAMQIFLLV